MPGSKITSLTSDQVRAALSRGEDLSDWARVQRKLAADPTAAEQNRRIGELIARRPGRPVSGETKTSISLRVPDSVLARWKATGPGWQTRMVERLADPAAPRA
jgi:uncharacterized protein (DUF4415 family)